MQEQALTFLKDLVKAESPTGHEAPAVKAWLKYTKPFSDEQFTDSYGNGFAILNPKGDPAVVLTGHADEIGLMITYIDDEGFLWVGSLGGYDAKILPAMRVKVLTSGGPVPGVIGALPPHLQRVETGGTELTRYKFGDNVYIDIGAKNKEEALKHVQVGDPVILDYGFMELAGETVVGRGLDNKIGIWAAAEGLRRASKAKTKPACKVIAIATVQEEIGGHGAAMAAFRTDPDVAIAVDVTQGMGHPGPERRMFGDQRMGRGPVLAHGSACHPKVVQSLERCAKKKRITLQHEALPGRTGTDADSIFTVRGGIPTAVLSIAQRYMHSPVESINLKDLDQTAEILAEFCLSLKKGERFRVSV